MKLEQSFEVDAPVDTVWTALIDVQRVAPCLPGAEVTEAGEDGSYQGTFSVKLGPATASYRGTIRIEEADEAIHRATMRASGTDKRGQGGAKATIVSTLAATDGGATRVDVVTDYAITGRLATFGRGGMIQDVSNRLLREFAQCLQTTLAADTPGEAEEEVVTPPAGGAGVPTETVLGVGTPSVPPTAGGAPGAAPRVAGAPSPQPKAKPISGLSLLLGALGDRLRRLFGRSPRRH
jgi:carbon monoxide dehydrogenase subunit G